MPPHQSLTKTSLTAVKQFQIYYGPVDTGVIEALRGTDMVFLEPQQVEVAQVRELQAAGTLVLGYLSVMEAPTWNQMRFSRLRESDFFRTQGTQNEKETHEQNESLEPNMTHGQKIHFPAWDSYLLDLREPHVQEVLLEEIRVLIVQKQMDGIFLDTVGDIEEYVPFGSVQEQMNQAYITWLQKVRTLFPSLHLIQNRGFDVLKGATPWLDGMLWEDWRGDLVKDEWVQARLAIVKACQQHCLPIFTQSSRPEPIHTETARECGFVHLQRSGGYHSL